MEYKTVAKSMAVLFFVSSAVTAFCLFQLAEFYITGELPFGIVPAPKILTEAEKVKSEAEKVAKEAEEKIKRQQEKPSVGYMNRFDEKMVLELYNRLRKKEEKIAEEEEKVANERKSAEEIKAQSQKMQKVLEEYRKKIKDLLVYVDKKDIENIKKITTLIEGLDIDQAVKLFMTFNKDKAARILYYMNPKIAKDIISNILENARDDMVKQDIKDITERMQRLTEEIGDE